MELRKVCNHAYLASSSDVEPDQMNKIDLHQRLVEASGKLLLLKPMLSKLKEKGHRVLIFSQFQIVLDILEEFLEGV